jgi:type IV secretory pathway VirB10-like protein
MNLGLRMCAVVALLAAGLSLVASADAQRFRYIDNSGNIHFVDSLSQVPERYMNQVVPPTPTPVYDRRALQEKKRQEQAAAREAAAQKSREQAEARRREAQRRQAEMKEQQRLKNEQSKSSFSRAK